MLHHVIDNKQKQRDFYLLHNTIIVSFFLYTIEKDTKHYKDYCDFITEHEVSLFAKENSAMRDN